SQGPAVPPPPSTPPVVPAQAPPVAGEAAAQGSEQPGDAEEAGPRKGTPVMVPPPDFNPFSMEGIPALPTDEPKPVAAAGAEPENRPFG
ncbi:hypothetical protein ACIQOV_09020, partial [Kitasatospora sp. NPDC091257]